MVVPFFARNAAGDSFNERSTGATGIGGGSDTVVAAVELSFELSVSGELVLTLAGLLSGPAAPGLTTMLTVAEAPAASGPSAHATVASPEQAPWEGEAETKGPPDGRVSVTPSALAVLVALLFFTASV